MTIHACVHGKTGDKSCIVCDQLWQAKKEIAQLKRARSWLLTKEQAEEVNKALHADSGMQWQRLMEDAAKALPDRGLVAWLPKSTETLPNAQKWVCTIYHRDSCEGTHQCTCNSYPHKSGCGLEKQKKPLTLAPVTKVESDVRGVGGLGWRSGRSVRVRLEYRNAQGPVSRIAHLGVKQPDFTGWAHEDDLLPDAD